MLSIASQKGKFWNLRKAENDERTSAGAGWEAPVGLWRCLILPRRSKSLPRGWPAPSQTDHRPQPQEKSNPGRVPETTL